MSDLDTSQLSYAAVYEQPVFFIWQDHPESWEPVYLIEAENLDDFVPVMNYYYRLPYLKFSEMEAQEILHHSCLSLVIAVVDDEPVMAFSGGGMDLSWEICEAYIQLGYFPPFHFNLPDIAGCCNNTVVDACTRSAEFVLSSAQRRIEQLQNLRC